MELEPEPSAVFIHFQLVESERQNGLQPYAKLVFNKKFSLQVCSKFEKVELGFAVLLSKDF